MRGLFRIGMAVVDSLAGVSSVAERTGMAVGDRNGTLCTDLAVMGRYRFVMAAEVW